MGQATDQAGNIWETDANGNPVRYIGKAGAQGGQAIAPNQLKVQGAQSDIRHTDTSTVSTDLRNTLDRATMAAQILKAQADAQKAAADAQVAQQTAAAKPNPAISEGSKKLQLDEVLRAINGARGRVSGWSTGWGDLLSPVPATDARDLRGDLSTIASALTVDKLQQMKAQSATGASGMGALSEKEGQLLRDSVAALDQGQSQEKVNDALNQIELHYRKLQAINSGYNPDDPKVAQAFGIVVPGVNAPSVGGPPAGGAGPNMGGGMGGGSNPGAPNGGGGGLQLVQGDSKIAPDPARAGMNAKVSAMLKAGASADQIRKFLQSAQIDPATVRGIDEAAAFRQKFPSYQGDYPVDVESVKIPLGTVGSTLNKLGQSGLGAYAMNAADALTAGNLAKMDSNPVAAQGAIDAISNNHGGAALLGNMTGGALAATGLETGLAGLGMKAAPAMLASDALYGGTFGASHSDNPLTGGLEGALIGVGGGKLGRGVAKGVGTLAKGVSNQAVQALNKAGVRMSVGQMLGGTAKSVEDRLAGFPIVGGIINSQRKNGLEDFQRAAFNRAVEPIGGNVGNIAEQGINQAQGAVSDAYGNALNGVMVQTDPAFKQEMRNVINQTAQRPRVGGELVSSMNDIASPMFGPGGTLRGTDAQNVFQGLEQLKSGYRRAGDPLYATQIAPSVDAYKGQIEGLLQRQAPGVMDDLLKANAANRNVSVLNDAVIAARNKGGQFTPAQLMNASKANTVAFSGKRMAASGNGPMFDLARAGNDVLPNQVPDSGTAGRLALYGLLGGGYGLGDYASASDNKKDATSSALKALAAASVLAGGAKALRPAAQKALTGSRSKAMQDLGQQIIDRSRYLGGATIAPAVPLLLPQ